MKSKQNQLIRAVKYIYENIDNPIVLKELAGATYISEASLKRLFKELLDESPGAFVRRLRMELAFKCLQSKTLSIIETALSVGYQDPSSFSRKFKQAFGFTPTSAKTKHSIISELDHIKLDDPEIVNMNEIKLQVVTEQGNYFEAAPRAWERLESHLSNDELDDDFAGMYVGVGRDNPHLGEVSADQVRFSAGVSCISRELKIESLVLPKGCYARFHFRGKPAQLGLAYHYILGQWEGLSGRLIQQDGLIYQIFDCFPNVEDDQVILICVPLV